MKKYVKPALFYEEFELSKHIADCAWELTDADSNTCSAKPDEALLPSLPRIFENGVNGCDAEIDGENYGDYCYHGDVDGANVFKS